MTMIDTQVFRCIKGFMHDDEARRLYSISLKAAAKGPVLEIGSYCGKSAYVIGSACKNQQSVLFSIDHHKGSEEQQPDQEYFDPDLLDKKTGRINTFPFFEAMIETQALQDTVIPLVAQSKTAGKMWQTPLSMVFIDGGHSYAAVLEDYTTWAGHVMPGGYLVFHDVFLDETKGGQAPRQVYEKAAVSKDFTPLEMTRTLGVLQKNT